MQMSATALQFCSGLGSGSPPPPLLTAGRGETVAYKDNEQTEWTVGVAEQDVANGIVNQQIVLKTSMYF